MIKIRRAEDRGHANYGWLDTHYTFSFNTYYDERYMGFRALRVINEDFIEPRQGFPTHSHRDMEIISYVVAGDLSHKDSIGNGTTIRPHEVQRMTAGTGVRHSEYSSETEKTHLLQIWIEPETMGLEPGYEQIYVAPEKKRGGLKLIAARAGGEDAVVIHQDASVYASILSAGQDVTHNIAAGRHAWVQVVKGSLEVNGDFLNTGDGAAVSEEAALKIRALEDETEFLLFDLA
jgi:redox-sensitive bicupin YhaK (pirin superfamily)